MRKLSIGALAATVVGLGASIASAIDDLGPKITFCSESGCQTVHQSAWARPLGVPMSLLGVGFFATMLALAFIEKRRLRTVLAIAGGVWAIWLIVLQAFVIDAWCKLCMVADPSAIVLAICVIAGARAFEPAWKRFAIVVPAIGAIVGGLALWTHDAGPPPPPPGTPQFVIDSQSEEAVTIVELVDFECPFCREMQKRLDEALTRTSVPVHVIRKMVPLPMHPGAVPAAIAWCCAEAQGKGEAMAHLLFTADPKDLTPYGCERMAEKAGCDLDRYHKDVASSVKRVQGDLSDAKSAGIHQLPTLFIGHDRHTGAVLSADELAAEIERHAP